MDSEIAAWILFGLFAAGAVFWWVNYRRFCKGLNFSVHMDDRGRLVRTNLKKE